MQLRMVPRRPQTDYSHPSASRTTPYNLFSKRFNNNSVGSQARLPSKRSKGYRRGSIEISPGAGGGFETEGHARKGTPLRCDLQLSDRLRHDFSTICKNERVSGSLVTVSKNATSFVWGSWSGERREEKKEERRGRKRRMAAKKRRAPINFGSPKVRQCALDYVAGIPLAPSLPSPPERFMRLAVILGLFRGRMGGLGLAWAEKNSTGVACTVRVLT